MKKILFGLESRGGSALLVQRSTCDHCVRRHLAPELNGTVDICDVGKRRGAAPAQETLSTDIPSQVVHDKNSHVLTG